MKPDRPPGPAGHHLDLAKDAPPRRPAAAGLPAAALDGWVVPPDTRPQRTRGRGSGRRTETMTQQLVELVEQFGNFQRKQRGKSDRGVKTYRWVLEQFLLFLKNQKGRMARVGDLTPDTIQAWMDHMAGADLALEIMRMRQSVLSSFCGWLVKRGVLPSNPVARLDRPPHRREAPKQVPGSPSWTRSCRRPGSGAGHETWPCSSFSGTPACAGSRSQRYRSGISIRGGGCGESG